MNKKAVQSTLIGLIVITIIALPSLKKLMTEDYPWQLILAVVLIFLLAVGVLLSGLFKKVGPSEKPKDDET